MKRLKNILLEVQREDDLQVLRHGLEKLQRKSHLVAGQVRNNKDHFLNNVDIEKFRKEFGEIKKFLGAGVFGAAFKLKNDKVFKLTFDYHEAPFLNDLQRNPREGMVEVDKVVSFPFGDTTAYGVVRDALIPVPSTKFSSEVRKVIRDLKAGRFEKEYQTKKAMEAKKALLSMYEMDPDWRGTHIDNLGVQNGEIVLFDGFSKGVEMNASSVPTINLYN